MPVWRRVNTKPSNSHILRWLYTYILRPKLWRIKFSATRIAINQYSSNRRKLPNFHIPKPVDSSIIIDSPCYYFLTQGQPYIWTEPNDLSDEINILLPYKKRDEQNEGMQKRKKKNGGRRHHPSTEWAGGGFALSAAAALLSAQDPPPPPSRYCDASPSPRRPLFSPPESPSPSPPPRPAGTVAVEGRSQCPDKSLYVGQMSGPSKDLAKLFTAQMLEQLQLNVGLILVDVKFAQYPKYGPKYILTRTLSKKSIYLLRTIFERLI